MASAGAGATAATQGYASSSEDESLTPAQAAAVAREADLQAASKRKREALDADITARANEFKRTRGATLERVKCEVCGEIWQDANHEWPGCYCFQGAIPASTLVLCLDPINLVGPVQL